MTGFWEEWFAQSDGIPGMPIARIRRGKRVVIPPEWRGKTVTRETRQKRQSRLTRKARRGAISGYPAKGEQRLTVQERRAPTVDEEW